MEYFPAPLEKLVEQFARLPGIGGKSAQRLAFHVLSLPMEDAQEFADAIVDAKRSVTLCPVCSNLTAGGLCPICANPKRESGTICVVADPRDVIAIERAREFGGHYHVLHGVLSPMNHVGPDDLQIKPLLDRVAQGGVECPCGVDRPLVTVSEGAEALDMVEMVVGDEHEVDLLDVEAVFCKALLYGAVPDAQVNEKGCPAVAEKVTVAVASA